MQSMTLYRKTEWRSLSWGEEGSKGAGPVLSHLIGQDSRHAPEVKVGWDPTGLDGHQVSSDTWGEAQSMERISTTQVSDYTVTCFSIEIRLSICKTHVAHHMLLTSKIPEYILMIYLICNLIHQFHIDRSWLVEVCTGQISYRTCPLPVAFCRTLFCSLVLNPTAVLQCYFRQLAWQPWFQQECALYYR